VAGNGLARAALAPNWHKCARTVGHSCRVCARDHVTQHSILREPVAPTVRTGGTVVVAALNPLRPRSRAAAAEPTRARGVAAPVSSSRSPALRPPRTSSSTSRTIFRARSSCRRPFAVITTSRARRSLREGRRFARPALSRRSISETMVLGSIPSIVPSFCWMAPSRAPITFSRANSAGVRPIVSNASAARVCEARQSRKKSCPANSAAGASYDAERRSGSALIGPEAARGRCHRGR
jgi:hypothetical protein